MISMWKLVKVLLFIGYILYAFKFMDNHAREGGILDAVFALIVAGLFGYGIFHFFWIYEEKDNKVNEQLNSNSDKLTKFNQTEAQKRYERDIERYIESFKEIYLLVDEEYQAVLFSMQKDRNLANLGILETLQREEEFNKVKTDAMQFLVKHRLRNGILKYEELKSEVQKDNKTKITSILQMKKSIL